MNREPVFDLFRYARLGPGRRDRLSPAAVAQIARTVHRAPEVMVKVLSQGANDLRAVRRHLDYIDRKGEVDLETDDGERRRGNGVGADLIQDWDLDTENDQPAPYLRASAGEPNPRLVHKVVFSMPPGTPPDKVLAATRNFLREEFALQHRYAMALHTDAAHPHVHVVLKAVSEQGKHLHIRKATLREWREGFARHLRAVGVEANATPRQVRGESATRKSDGIYRAVLRGESTHMRKHAEAVARQLARGRVGDDPGKEKLVQTRDNIRRTWGVIGEILNRAGQAELSVQVQRFVNRMPPPATEREVIAAQIIEGGRAPPVRSGPHR